MRVLLAIDGSTHSDAAVEQVAGRHREVCNCRAASA